MKFYLHRKTQLNKTKYFHLDGFYTNRFTEQYKNKSGLYFFIKNRELVYIGHSTNIGNRLDNHISNEEKDFDLIGLFIDELNLIDVKVIESILINLFTPKYNKLIPKIIKPSYNSHDYQRDKTPINEIEADYLTEFFKSDESTITRFLKQNKDVFQKLGNI